MALPVRSIPVLLLCCLLIFSCKKPDRTDTNNIELWSEAKQFLFNVPIIADTVFIDKKYNIDIRVELAGRSIDSVTIISNGSVIFACDTTIISSQRFRTYNNFEIVEFLIRSVNVISKDTVFFRSKPIYFKTVDNLSNRYVLPSVENGKLKLVWHQFDKKHTQKYLIERYIIDDYYKSSPKEKKHFQAFEVSDSVFFDDYYVGEKSEYKITVINNEGNKQDMWYYIKSAETPDFHLSQSPTGGYVIHFGQCKYYSNFGQYCLTDGMGAGIDCIHTTTQIKDTTYYMSDAKFGDEARLWIRYLPKKYPEGFLEEDWRIYGKFFFSLYGITSIAYENIVVLDNNTLAYTSDGKIFKHNIANNRIMDSIVNQDAYYEFLRSTPDGKYIYASNRKISQPILHFWSTNFSQNPIYNFHTNYIVPPVSNNLLAIMSISCGYVPCQLAIYDITNGNIMYTTNYDGTSEYPAISPNGNYLFISTSSLRLCSYINNSFKVIWEESDWLKFYRFYSFNRLNNDVCYVWDDNKTFSVRKTADFSVINSFPIELEEIVDIDYYSNKIMGYVTDKIMIYDLNNGSLIKEIPANLRELFLYSNKTVLLNNTIYNNNGIKYMINQ